MPLISDEAAKEAARNGTVSGSQGNNVTMTQDKPNMIVGELF